MKYLTLIIVTSIFTFITFEQKSYMDIFKKVVKSQFSIVSKRSERLNKEKKRCLDRVDVLEEILGIRTR